MWRRSLKSGGITTESTVTLLAVKASKTQLWLRLRDLNSTSCVAAGALLVELKAMVVGSSSIRGGLSFPLLPEITWLVFMTALLDCSNSVA